MIQPFKSELSMEIQWDTQYIDPQNLISISRGDQNRMLKYLKQFQELVPQRVALLKNSIEAMDRKTTRQILHQMTPQMQFFGIPGVTAPIRKLELEYESMPIEDLTFLVNEITNKLDKASNEVSSVLEKYF